ncbi:hypothetical protein LB545_01235 [Mesorhizobium sp. BR1-1-6]|uniref:hypothetical protein n=1 Tax=Mesorhizobium sp. BR1-1-6 TaxID=2876648 RepID=UPI001CD1023F|nr:hypothetical protein [Mesorhizobium sp. BR1-1-6]MBZ9892948.1 hypothetical protein [Mesorhizobium sp. BR1-1-6]
MMKKPDKTDDDVASAVTWLIDHDLDVTARAVARRVDVAPSTITRDDDRMKAVEDGIREQARLRAIVARDKSSREELLARLEREKKTVAKLERQVAILTASHRAMLMAVGEIGGVAAWRKFFAKHEEIRQELIALNACQTYG